MENKQIKEEPDVQRQKSKCPDDSLEPDSLNALGEEENTAKVKRLFSSLVNHAKEHSAERGDSVARLVTNLVVGSINFDEFEKSLFDLTKSNPRPYVISYLKAYTPTLQKEMSQGARNSKTNIMDYVATHLHESDEVTCKSEVYGENLKRRREKYEDEYSPPTSRPLLVPVHPLAASNPINQPLRPSNEEQWRNIDVMLNCILSMVEKTIAAIGILQGRTADELMAQTIRLTEDRVAQVKKRAEEAVAEVNRKALLELQRAVSAAETRANQLAAADLPRRSEKIQVSGPHNSCWNCGRKAQETCSGCNVAKYCSSFCQHKDWENHHATCRNKFK